MKVHCRSNLDDVCSYEEWPTELPSPPRIGDSIESRISRKGQHLKLKVVDCTWRYSDLYHEWYVTVELHLRKSCSISEFQDWYQKLRNA